MVTGYIWGEILFFAIRTVIYGDLNKLVMENETTLLQQIAEGDEVAFRKLFDHHKSRTYNYLLRITKSKEIAEEIVLDVFLKLWIGRDLILEIKNVEGFLHKVALNKALDFFRLAARQKKLQILIDKEILGGNVISADHSLLENECADIINKALASLSPQRRLILDLSRNDGMTHDEIAAHLNLSRNTVKNTITDGLKILRKYLKDHHYNSLAGIVILQLS
jgi:RNA polymerase sigma-70 factor (family 1)